MGLDRTWPGAAQRRALFNCDGCRSISQYRAVSPNEHPGAFLFKQQLPNGPLVEGSRGALDLITANKGMKSAIRLAAGRELPGSRIQAVFADREGALWIGTNAGLVRWAGGRVDRFPITDPLATASILSLLEDREGDLWVGTESGGFHILRDERFGTFGAHEGLSSDAITTVVEDRSGTLWVGRRKTA